MSEQLCPQCGRPLEEGNPCPHCLLQLAAEPSGDCAGSVPGSLGEFDIEAIRNAFPQLEVIESIGHGGMGTVFKARQPKLDRFVALKILSADLEAKPGFAERFTQEGKLLARLNHPNIVAVYDVGESGGFYYLLMEYVDGVNLRQAIREERFTPEQAIAIVPKICDALQYAHTEGVLHRDIKPENILLDTKGRIKIADFGIAKFYRARSVSEEPLTQTGQVLGTPSYMAPEQLDDPNHVDHRADIYSLGVVFYELLTGELPRGHFPVPSKTSSVSIDIDQIVLRALERDREKRQQSAEEFKTEVESATISPPPNDSASSANSATPPQTPKRSRNWLVGCGLFLIMMILIQALVLWSMYSSFPYRVSTGHIIMPMGIESIPFDHDVASATLHAKRTIFPGVIIMGLGISIFLLLFVILIALIYVLIKWAVNSQELRPSPMPTKFCTHCGAGQTEGAYACPKCGCATRKYRNYCFNCGIKIAPEQILCVKCGVSLAQSPLAMMPGFGGRKNKLIAGLLALFLGWLGIHKFYLESWGWGLVYLLLSGTCLPLIVGIIEGILFLIMGEQTFDGRYNQTQPAPFRW